MNKCPYCGEGVPLKVWAHHSLWCKDRIAAMGSNVDLAVSLVSKDQELQQHKITPAALDLVDGQEFGLDLDDIEATGRDGTITVQDVRQYLEDLKEDQIGRDL